MSSSRKSSPPSKNCWCLGALGAAYNQKGMNIQNVQICRYGVKDCYNAHSQSEITEDSYISAWASRNKSDINLGALDKELRSVIGAEKDSIKNPTYISASREMDTLRLDKLLFLWWDITCYHRKIAKDLRRTGYVEGYSNPKAVPKFYLSNEEHIWALVRTLRICEKHLHLVKNPMESIDIKDICVGDINCKHGVHKNCLLACVDDILFGTCDCKSLEEIKEEKQLIADQITSLRAELKKDGCEMIATLKKMHVLHEKSKSLARKVHYTEQGMVPLSVHKEIEKKTGPKTITTDTISGKPVRKVGKKKK
jgi:hypothetical protein